MVGKTVVGLMAVFCISCVLTEVNSQLPEFDRKRKSDCNSFAPDDGGFASIVGLGYVLEFSGSPFNCLTLNIQPESKDSNAFTETYSYYNGSISSQQSIVIQNPANPGEVQSYLSKPDGTFEYQRTTVLLTAAFGPTSNVIAYTLLSCNAAGVKQLAIVVKGKPPQSSYLANDQKAEVYEEGLEDVPLHEIHHGSDCVYVEPSD